MERERREGGRDGEEGREGWRGGEGGMERRGGRDGEEGREGWRGGEGRMYVPTYVPTIVTNLRCAALWWHCWPAHCPHWEPVREQEVKIQCHTHSSTTYSLLFYYPSQSNSDPSPVCGRSSPTCCPWSQHCCLQSRWRSHDEGCGRENSHLTLD